MSTRFDSRDKNTFTKDIKFTTGIEKFLFHKWLETQHDIVDWSNNGCDNDGEYIEEGVDTSGADYKITTSEFKDQPLEVKWVPVHSKMTLKKLDLEAYIKEGANILFIYPKEYIGDLRKPKNNYDLDKHVNLIESKLKHCKWAIMSSAKVKELHSYAEKLGWTKFFGKDAHVIKQKEFSQWFKEENWN